MPMSPRAIVTAVSAMENALQHRIAKVFTTSSPLDMAIDFRGGLNQVILAQKQAEATLIRRREETAAARSQANTAKLLAENPVLARMKELEALQEILAGAKTTFVLGPGDVASQVRRLVVDEVTGDIESGKDAG